MSVARAVTWPAGPCLAPPFKEPGDGVELGNTMQVLGFKLTATDEQGESEFLDAKFAEDPPDLPDPYH